MIDINQTLEQLGTKTVHRLAVMIGAKNFMQSQEDSYLQFDHMRAAKNKATKVRIFLTGDLYNIVWYKKKRVEVAPGLKITDYVECDRVEMVYGDQLREVFQEHTGLALSL